MLEPRSLARLEAEKQVAVQRRISVQRLTLRALASSVTGMTVPEIVQAVYGRAGFTPAEASSVRRAIANLVRKGRVVQTGKLRRRPTYMTARKARERAELEAALLAELGGAPVSEHAPR